MYELFPLRSVRSPHPAQSYAEAIDRSHEIRASEDGEINECCRTFLLTHGKPTQHAIVLIHGFTNCPYQYQALAPRLHEQGHTVLVTRLPHHGHADRLTTALADLKVSTLLNTVTEGVDIAQGLGEQVTVIGFSLGGILAAWLGQERDDLYQAILVSPAIGLQALSQRRQRLAAHLAALLPNFFLWWDPERKEELDEPLHAYPRFASRSLAVLLRLGVLVLDHASQTAPATTRFTLISNPSDPVIDQNAVARLMEAWQAYGASLSRHDFPVEWELLHDLIDPLQPDAQIERVYPLLLEWIDESLSASVIV